MPTPLSISSALIVVLGLAACGGKGKGPAGPGGSAAARLPWEAGLTVGARFELADELAEDGADAGPVVVTVTAVEPHGEARIYRLDWGDEANGPTSITVEDGKVTVGDAALGDMQEPWPEQGTDAICYAADYSNPEGCDDVCDASLCLSPTAGITSVGGLYAPNYGMFRQR